VGTDPLHCLPEFFFISNKPNKNEHRRVVTRAPKTGYVYLYSGTEDMASARPTWACTVRDSTCYQYYVAATSLTTTTWLATSLQDYSYVIFCTEDSRNEESTEDEDFLCNK